MRAYPDGMQRLALWGTAIAAALLLALPAAAVAPEGWEAGTGASGTFTVLRTDDAIGLAGGFDGAIATTADDGRSWTSATPPTDAAIRDLAGSGAQTLFALDARGALWRSPDAGATWAQLQPPAGTLAIATLSGNRMVAVARRAIALSEDGGDHFTPVTPKLARADSFTGVDQHGALAVVHGPHSLVISDDLGRHWQHMRLPPLARGDSLLDVSFVSRRLGFALTAFRRLYRTRDSGHHWSELLGTGGAGADLDFADAHDGWLAAPGFAGRFDGYVLHTTDGGLTWRPQPVAPRFLSKVAAARSAVFAIANEGTALFATRAGESGTPITVGFRPTPRVARRGGSVGIRGRVNPVVRGAGVAVSMRSAGRWIVRFVRTDRQGVFAAKFRLQRRAAFVVQVPAGAGHGSAAAKPVFVPVR